MYEVPFTGWSPAKYENDNTHGKRDYYRALFEHVRSLPEIKLEMPVYVIRDRKLVLLAEVAAIPQAEVPIVSTDIFGCSEVQSISQG